MSAGAMSAGGGAGPMRRQAEAARNRAAGFTLLEVLVALVVLGFVVAGLAQGTQFGMRAWAVQGRGIGAHADLDAADRTLRQLVGGMVPGNEQDPPNIEGTAGRLAFTTRLPDAAGLNGGEADVALGVDARAGLVLRWTPHRHAVPLGPPPPPRQVTVLPGLARLELAYWRADGRGGWLPSWSDRVPPALVRIRLVFPAVGKEAPHWPDIVAAPMRGG